MGSRRDFLQVAAGALVLSGGAGCSQTPNSNADPSTQSQTATPSPKQNPKPAEVSWSEEWIRGKKYRLKISVQFRDSKKVTIKSGPNHEEVTILKRSSGKTSWMIAGPSTNYGAAKHGTPFDAFATNPGSGAVQTINVGTHLVGSQDQPSMPLFLNGLSGGTDPDLSNSETTTREYTQTVDNRKTEFTIQIPTVLSKYYKSRSRIPEYGAYVSDQYDDQYIKSLTTDFERFGDRNGLSTREVIDHIIGFVQQLQYSRDKASTGFNEYPKYPTETLLDKGGDCEDTCILLASMLEQMGYGTVLLVFWEAQHMAVGIAGEDSIDGTYYEHDGQRFYYLETTAPGWNVGEVPESVRQNPSAEIREVAAQPSLVFNYGVSVPSSGGAKVQMKIANVGDAPAKQTVGVAQFQDKNQNVVASKSTSTFRIPPNKQKTTSVRLFPPDNKQLRAQLGVKIGGQTHDITSTEYRAPNE